MSYQDERYVRRVRIYPSSCAGIHDSRESQGAGNGIEMSIVDDSVIADSEVAKIRRLRRLLVSPTIQNIMVMEAAECMQMQYELAVKVTEAAIQEVLDAERDDCADASSALALVATLVGVVRERDLREGDDTAFPEDFVPAEETITKLELMNFDLIRREVDGAL